MYFLHQDSEYIVCCCLISLISSLLSLSFTKHIPLINEHSLPEVLRENPKISCIVGLNTEPDRLVEIRKNRMSSLKENKNKLYTDLEQIKKEVNMARNTFKKYKWPSIDVTRKSVEETAASIIKIYEIYKENA